MSFSDFSAASLIGGLLFSLVGYAAFRYGKSAAKSKPLMVGIALMVYPYFIYDPAAVWLVGAALTASLYLLRE